MHRMSACVCRLLLVGILFPGVAWAESAGSLEYSEETVILPSQQDDCSDGTLVYNHDGSFEQAYAWAFGGIVPPYYGAFGEAYDLGPGDVVCGSYWFTHVYEWPEYPIDLYIWDGGLTGEPGEVLCMVPDVVPYNVPHWPECGQNDMGLGCCVAGEFTVGYWLGLPGDPRRLFICSDENGPPGCPWTCIAPGIGYPTGWRHPNVIWPECQSLGCGVWFSRDPAGVEELPEHGGASGSPTWGSIKALFQ